MRATGFYCVSIVLILAGMEYLTFHPSEFLRGFAVTGLVVVAVCDILHLMLKYYREGMKFPVGFRTNKNKNGKGQ